MRFSGLVLAAVSLLVGAAPAQARLVVAISQPGASDPHGIGQRDIRILDPLDPNASEFDRDLRLQVTVNSSIDETDLSLSADGRYLAFKRTHPFTFQPAGAREPGRFITDRSLERNSPLATKPMDIEGGTTGTGAISPDARRFASDRPGFTGMEMGIYSLDLSGRPIPAALVGTIPSPFPNLAGDTGTPAFEFGGQRVTWSLDPETGPDGIAVGRLGGTTQGLRAPPPEGDRRIGVSDAVFWPCCARDHVLFAHNFTRRNSDGAILAIHRDLGYWELSDPTPHLARFDLGLEPVTPGIADRQELAPKTSPDGRYIAWIEPGGNERIRVWDRMTQGYVNDGVSLGPGLVQSWALAQTDAPLIASFQAPSVLTAVTPATTLGARLDQPVSVGILVKRVAGTTTLLGQRVRRLVAVGRVPLGRQRRGRVRIPWSGRVNGRRLRPGLYQITLRALHGARVVDLSKPRLVRVR